MSAVESTCGHLLRLPGSGRPFGRRLRRLLAPGSPYGILYRVEEERVVDVAVAHLRRRPGYWRDRKSAALPNQALQLSGHSEFPINPRLC
jgi:hypothetical protein